MARARHWEFGSWLAPKSLFLPFSPSPSAPAGDLLLSVAQGLPLEIDRQQQAYSARLEVLNGSAGVGDLEEVPEEDEAGPPTLASPSPGGQASPVLPATSAIADASALKKPAGLLHNPSAPSLLGAAAGSTAIPASTMIAADRDAASEVPVAVVSAAFPAQGRGTCGSTEMSGVRAEPLPGLAVNDHVARTRFGAPLPHRHRHTHRRPGPFAGADHGQGSSLDAPLAADSGASATTGVCRLDLSRVIGCDGTAADASGTGGASSLASDGRAITSSIVRHVRPDMQLPGTPKGRRHAIHELALAATEGTDVRARDDSGAPEGAEAASAMSLVDDDADVAVLAHHLGVAGLTATGAASATAGSARHRHGDGSMLDSPSRGDGTPSTGSHVGTPLWSPSHPDDATGGGSTRRSRHRLSRLVALQQGSAAGGPSPDPGAASADSPHRVGLSSGHRYRRLLRRSAQQSPADGSGSRGLRTSGLRDAAAVTAVTDGPCAVATAVASGDGTGGELRRHPSRVGALVRAGSFRHRTATDPYETVSDDPDPERSDGSSGLGGGGGSGFGGTPEGGPAVGRSVSVMGSIATEHERGQPPAPASMASLATTTGAEKGPRSSIIDRTWQCFPPFEVQLPPTTTPAATAASLVNHPASVFSPASDDIIPGARAFDMPTSSGSGSDSHTPPPIPWRQPATSCSADYAATSASIVVTSPRGSNAGATSRSGPTAPAVAPSAADFDASALFTPRVMSPTATSSLGATALGAANTSLVMAQSDMSLSHDMTAHTMVSPRADPPISAASALPEGSPLSTKTITSYSPPENAGTTAPTVASATAPPQTPPSSARGDHSGANLNGTSTATETPLGMANSVFARGSMPSPHMPAITCAIAPTGSPPLDGSVITLPLMERVDGAAAPPSLTPLVAHIPLGTSPASVSQPPLPSLILARSIGPPPAQARVPTLPTSRLAAAAQQQLRDASPRGSSFMTGAAAAFTPSMSGGGGQGEPAGSGTSSQMMSPPDLGSPPIVGAVSPRDTQDSPPPVLRARAPSPRAPSPPACGISLRGPASSNLFAAPSPPPGATWEAGGSGARSGWPPRKQVLLGSSLPRAQLSLPSPPCPVPRPFITSSIWRFIAFADASARQQGIPLLRHAASLECHPFGPAYHSPPPPPTGLSERRPCSSPRSCRLHLFHALQWCACASQGAPGRSRFVVCHFFLFGRGPPLPPDTWSHFLDSLGSIRRRRRVIHALRGASAVAPRCQCALACPCVPISLHRSRRRFLHHCRGAARLLPVRLRVE